MKKINLFAMSLLALLMACFTACENKYAVDHTAELVGTWTSLKPGYAEALTIKADGTVISTGYENGEYWENVAGTYVIENDVATMTFEDGDVFKGHIDVVPGIAFTIYTEDGEHWTFNTCKEDFSDEIVGMWVCVDGPTNKEDDMLIQVFNADGSTIMTGNADELLVNDKSTTYKVVGDLLFLQMNKETVSYVPFRITYAPNGTSLGDIMSLTLGLDNANIAATTSWVRVKESLNFTGQTYDYSVAYVSNAKGKDEDFSILGHTFNMANIEGGNFDMLFRSELFCLDLNANSIKQHFLSNGRDIEIEIPVTVDGNKVTLDLSAENSAFRPVDMYMFQSANDSQLHMYMHKDAFVNYFANMELYNLIAEGKVDTADTAAVEKVFSDMEARVESINLSLVFKVRN